MIPIMPKGWAEKFVEEHPIQAVLFVMCGVVLAWFSLYMLVMR